MSIPSLRKLFRPIHLSLVAFAVSLSCPQTSHATQILWDIPIGKNNILSTGAPWPDMMVMELGVFVTGFSPTASNMASWAANWRPASRSTWDAPSRYYSGVVNFSDNAAPFLAGANAWVWGIRGSEWILFRRSNWVWPTGSPIGGPPTTWTADATVAFLTGSLVGSGATFTLKTAASTAAVPTLCYADWKTLTFNEDEVLDNAISGPDADPDSDGAPNFMEYLGSTRPNRKSARKSPDSAELFVSGATRYLAVRLTFDPRACFTYTGQTSTNLTTWTTTPLTLRTSAPGSQLFSSNFTIAPGKRYLRLKFAP